MTRSIKYQDLRIHGMSIQRSYSSFYLETICRGLAAYLYLRPLTMQISLSEPSFLLHVSDTSVILSYNGHNVPVTPTSKLLMSLSITFTRPRANQGPGQVIIDQSERSRLFFARYQSAKQRCSEQQKGSADWTQAGVGISSHLYSRRGPRCVLCV